MISRKCFVFLQCPIGLALLICTTATCTSWADLNAGLVAFYHFDGDARDASANGNDGTIVGPVTFVRGLIGNAAHFPGSNGVEIIVNPVLGNFGTSNFTVAAWVRTSNGGSLIEKRVACDCANNYFGINLGQPLGFIHYNVVSNAWCTGESGTIPYPIDAEWHHVVFMRDTNMLSCYVDGAFSGGAITGNYISDVDNTALFTIGESVCDGLAFEGDIDELRIYNRAVSIDEIHQLHQPYFIYAGTFDGIQFQMNVQGLSLSRPFALYQSTNLIFWELLLTNPAPPPPQIVPSLPFVVPIDKESGQHFFKIREL